ncbi:unnamed protein product [Pedinophyceae sp. YPF-701]|nr:unnamed protein product [Pedinophyceae sp. YPF-701]
MPPTPSDRPRRPRPRSGDVAFVKTFRGQGGSPEDGHNGTASVEFEDENDAMTAVRTFHRHPIGDDRFLSVRRDRKADPSRGPLVANAAGRQVVFFGLPYRYSEDDVRLIVEGVAPTEAVQIVRDHHGSSRGFARVAFQTEEGARLAIERLDGVVKHGRLWAVKFDKFAAGVPHRTVAHGDSAEGEDLGGGESGEEDSADTRS